MSCEYSREEFERDRMGQAGDKNGRDLEAMGHCNQKLDGCRKQCCNCEKCIATKGRKDICANCAAALKKTTFAR